MQVMRVHHDKMPNLTKIAAAIAVIPVSTSDCERGFSAMKRVKTPLRNQLKQQTLYNLLMITIEGPEAEQFPLHEVCDHWVTMAKRRLNVSA